MWRLRNLRFVSPQTLGDRKGRGYFFLRSVSGFAAKKRGHCTLSDLAGLLIRDARASGGEGEERASPPRAGEMGPDTVPQ